MDKEKLEKKVVNLLENYAGKPLKTKEIQKMLKVSSRDYPVLKSCIRKLLEIRQIERIRNRRYRLPVAEFYTGIFRSGKYGFGFVSTERGDIYIHQNDRLTALPGDKVKVEIISRKRGKSREGRIIEIIEKRKKEIVGTYKKTKISGYVSPDDFRYVPEIIVPDSRSGKASNGQKVVVRIDNWKSESMNPEGTIIEVIGYPGEKGIDMLSIARSYGFPAVFPDEVIEEAEIFNEKDLEKEFGNRADLRDKLIFTIDPEEAKDFDDGISLEEKEDGILEIGVHIADVSFFVKETTQLDKEARKRGTSLYLINKVIPMLPENLSNNLCSLVPGKDRLAFSVIIDIKKNGEIAGYRILESIIKSKKRFSYGEAQNILDGKKRSKYRHVLQKMAKLARLLRYNREQAGSIDFDIPEVEFELDENDFPVSTYKKPLYETNQLIEEFMLLANRVTARHCAVCESRYRLSLPYIYRVHAEPDREDLAEFAKLVKAMGYKIIRKGKNEIQWLQHVLHECQGKPEENLIKEVALRSMKKAVYSSDNIGHYALAFDDYTHFTSPIRRYPDLMLHRLIKLYTNGVNPGEVKVLKKEVDYVCDHSSEMEQLSEVAEREAIKLKQIEYMKLHVGEVFSAVISGVTSYGLFVETSENLAEGLIHIKDLTDDYYQYDEKKYSLKGLRNGRVYRLGDRIDVLLVRVDEEEKHIDFIPYGTN